MECCLSAPSHDPKQCWPFAWVKSTYIDLREILLISEPWIGKIYIEMSYIKFQLNISVRYELTLIYGNIFLCFIDSSVNPFLLKWHVKYGTLGMEKDNYIPLFSCVDIPVMQLRKVKLLCHNGAICNLTHCAPMIWYAVVKVGKNYMLLLQSQTLPQALFG